MASDPCAAGFFSQLFHGNALLCVQKSGNVAAGQAEIQSVADNASQAYGPDSIAAQVAQQTADVQKNYVVGDVTQITSDIGNSDIGNPLLNDSCDGLDFTVVGLGCLTKTTLYVVAGIIVLIILGPYLLPYLLPRRR